MGEQHPIVLWAGANGTDIAAIAASCGCSESHLRNIIAGRKDASLGLAKRLSDHTKQVVPDRAFLRPEITPQAVE